MTKRALSVFSLLFGLSAILMVVGCDLDGSDSSDDARAEIDQAIAQAQAEEQQQQESSSSNDSSSGSSSTASASSSSGGGSGGFLWKPISEGDGNLVVLLPSSLRGRVNGASIERGGSTVERGRFTGDTHNGNRPHYRFSRPGAAYGSGLTLRAFLSGGGTQAWSIPNGASRVER